MAGSSITLTYDETGPIKKIIGSWVSDDSAGTASVTTKKIVGRLLKGITNPGATAPTDNYDITITDEQSVDVLAQCQDDLVDRDTANTECVYFFLKDYTGTPVVVSQFPVVCDVLTIAVANAGNSKVGEFAIYWEP